jgi:NAD(P)-dependent dehydrogenase (short-subunit alcohol dehydrogenase family)
MSTRDLSGTTAIITGASRGFGRATAIAIAAQGALVVGVARNEGLLHEVAEQIGDRLTPVVADVTDPHIAERLVSIYQPRTLVLNAGATPAPNRLSRLSWDSFATNWNVDVKHVFHFIQQALRHPLDPGSVVISLSSGAAIAGSPLSGGYAGAKATIKFISDYATFEAATIGADIRFVAVLPQLTPATDLGRLYTHIYADQAGLTQEQFLKRFGGTLSPYLAGKMLTELATDDSYDAPAYVLTVNGLQPAN